MLDIISIPTVLEIHARQGCRALSTVSSLMQLKLVGSILILRPHWLEAAHRLYLGFMLLTILLGRLKLFLQFLHVLLIETWWTHIGKVLLCFIILDLVRLCDTQPRVRLLNQIILYGQEWS